MIAGSDRQLPLIVLNFQIMTTFQAIIYAMIHGIAQFLPLNPSAHEAFIPYLIGWEAPPLALIFAMTFGTFLALFLYFIHEWASMISCTLQVILFRKRPMTLDERLPIFIGISVLPSFFTKIYFSTSFDDSHWNLLMIAGFFAAAGLGLWFTDSMSRRTKGIYDWNWLDALIIGGIQTLSLIPGVGPFTGILAGGLFLNYTREASTKYAYFILAPLLLVQSSVTFKEVNLQGGAPATDLSWLSFGVAGLVSFLIGLLCIGGYMKHIERKGYAQYAIYRCVLALGVVALFWIRSGS